MGCNNSTSESEVKWQYTARSELRGTAEAKGTASSTTTIKWSRRQKQRMQTMADVSMAALLKRTQDGNREVGVS